jgi:hypothetical protein
MKVRCPKCGMLLKFRDSDLGKHGKCPRCHFENVAQWDDVIRSATSVEQPNRLRTMPIVWGCVAVFGLGAAGFITHTFATNRPAHSASGAFRSDAAALSAAPVLGQIEPAAVTSDQTSAAAVAQEAVPAAQAGPDTNGSTTSVDAAKSTASPRGAASSVRPRPTGTPSVDLTPSGQTIYTGPRGGRYHYSASGRKVYERHRR